MHKYGYGRVQIEKEGGYQPKDSRREIREGYQPTTQQTGNTQQGNNGNTNRPNPPSGGSGVTNGT